MYVSVSSEFCGCENKKEGVDKDQVPKQNMVDFLLETSAQLAQNSAESKGSIVYCIDVSGSMSVSTAVPELQGNTIQWNLS